MVSVENSGSPHANTARAAQVDGVWFAYEGMSPVLKGVSLAVERGGVHCLMGPNGCGKSTLLDCVLGFNRPLRGTVVVADSDVLTLPPAALAREVAYVPQVHERSFPYLVEQVVLMGRIPYQRGFAPPDDRDRAIVADALKTVGIEELANRPYTRLSGGEAQLVLLARALAQQAPLIVMDEPTAHLDLRNSVKFLEIVSRLVIDGACSALVATHHPEQPFFLEASGCPVTVSLMNGGEIVAVGAPGATVTEASLSRVFRVEARVLDSAVRETVPLRGVVPIRTLDGGDAKHDA